MKTPIPKEGIMTVYAFVTTFILGGVSSIVALFAYYAHQDGKALKNLEQREKERHAAMLLDTHYRAEDQEQTAVDLVKDKLGATILNIEQKA